MPSFKATAIILKKLPLSEVDRKKFIDSVTEAQKARWLKDFVEKKSTDLQS